MDGGYNNLQELLEKNEIHSNDFLCEGYGCIFQPCQNFTLNKVTEEMMGIPFEDLDDNMEINCEMFEKRKNMKEKILIKNVNRAKILVNPNRIRDHYYVY